MKLKSRIFFIAILFLIFFGWAEEVWAANIYVDNNLASDCVSNNYSITNRACNSSNGKAYNTVQKAVNAMSAGDHIILRGGTYQECINIPISKNGTAWTEGNYNKISSCSASDGCASNEWAILDGNHACAGVSQNGAVIGYWVSTEDGSGDLKYWWFERLEIRNGSGEGTAYGILANGGPFKVRYCYIHDNIAPDCNNLPAGIWGQQWHDSVIEYNWIKDNGGTAQHNCANVGWISAYGNSTSIADNMNFGGLVIDKSNEIRYNYIQGSNQGFKVKHFTLFTGRNTATGHDYEDTYKDYNTKIHHNIFTNQAGHAIGAHGDFWQVYNNIIDSPGEKGIVAQYDYVDYWFMYKTTIYNNTIINPGEYGGVLGMGRRFYTNMNQNYYGYVYNNICDNCGAYNGWCSEGADFNPQMYCSSSNAINYSNAYVSNNYSYRYRDSSQYRISTTSYTAPTFESQTVTHTPKVAFRNLYDAANLLYEGTSGADKYRIKAGHIIGSTTAGAGGIGGSHPFLNGITIPSYIGAANPNDNAWVAGVLNLASVLNMQNAGNGDPNWIEGGGSSNTTPPAAPQGLTVQ